MTRKHFEMMARAAYLTKPLHRGDGWDVWYEFVNNIADECELISDRFDRVRFIYACTNG